MVINLKSRAFDFFDDRGYKLKYWAFDFLITMVINL
jgi:hypothetical protein